MGLIHYNNVNKLQSMSIVIKIRIREKKAEKN